MEQPLTPKPDPIILKKAEPVVPMVELQPATTTSKVGISNAQRLKEFAKKHKKLVIALTILGIALLLAIILIIFSYKPAGTIKNEQSTVSAPISEKVKAIVLSKKCPAANQDIVATVPDDWTCGATTENIKDLSVTNGDISIAFPFDIQPSLGCGLDTTSCKSEVIYNSNKVIGLAIHSRLGKISDLTAGIKLGDKTFVVNVRLKDSTQTELTPDQKALILQILENIEATPASTSTTMTLSFTVDPIFGTQSGTKSLIGSIVVDKDTSLVQKSASAVSITKGNTALVISNIHEWFTDFFQKADFVGSTQSLGNAYRVVLGGEGGSQIFYVPAANLKLGADKCTGISSPTGYYNAPCGEIAIDAGYEFQCASTNGVNDLDFCDSVVQNLTFTLRSN